MSTMNDLEFELAARGIRFQRTALPCGTAAIVTEDVTYIALACTHGYGVYTADPQTHRLLVDVLRHGNATAGLD